MTKKVDNELVIAPRLRRARRAEVKTCAAMLEMSMEDYLEAVLFHYNNKVLKNPQATKRLLKNG
ncbi:MAG: hypothetical protein KAS32_30580 [Candidatus Peribacteraceae bacterium]|nr:hypothetical protein [Candidatus Peribacteraceae bacterium]